eukprot:9307194-Alexandrium_andersonii.AAC.1
MSVAERIAWHREELDHRKKAADRRYVQTGARLSYLIEMREIVRRRRVLDDAEQLNRIDPEAVERRRQRWYAEQAAHRAARQAAASAAGASAR